MCRILIVDDAPSARVLMQKALHGYDTAEAASGAEARDVFSRDSPELVLLDLEMPDVVGMELLEDFSKTATVIVITGVSDENTLVSCYDGGADDVLQKPVNVALLRRKVQQILSHRMLRIISQGICEVSAGLNQISALLEVATGERRGNDKPATRRNIAPD